jgi:acetolactate synthase-1/2/3 large subunit
LKKKTFIPDIGVEADLKEFLSEFERNLPEIFPKYDLWMKYCSRIRMNYPMPEYNYEKNNYASSYKFPLILSHLLPKNSCIVTGNGTAYTSTFQAYKVRRGDRIFANVGCAAMGYDLPAAIGACIGQSKQEIICLTGDGSIQMNLQELQTIIHYRLPIKIFMYNNGGYLSIRITQINFFSSHITISTRKIFNQPFALVNAQPSPLI